MTKRIDYAGVVLSMDPEQEERKQVRTQLQWDYGQVPALHRKAVEDAAVEILVSGRKMQQSVLLIGQRLSEVKRLLDHGQFGDWCEREFGMNVRTAQRMMSVAANLDGKSDKLSHLGTSVLYLIGADSTPEPVREAVIEQAESTGRAPSVAEVRKSIRLFVENLRGIVRLWAEEHWLRSGREIPSNPAHTNGEFWQGLTTWMHANVTDTWSEGDLKAAIKQEYRVDAPAPAVEVVTERGVELAAPENDDRHARLRRWWVRLMALQNDLLDWGYLTGRHLATGEVERGLRKMLEITQRELDLLEGREVPTWGEEVA